MGKRRGEEGRWIVRVGEEGGMGVVMGEEGGMRVVMGEEVDESWEVEAADKLHDP